MLNFIKRVVKSKFCSDDLPFVSKSVLELNNFNELKKVFKWEKDPILDRPDIYDFDYVEDINERRIRDAESVATVMCNVRPKVALEIGTSTGLATVLMAANSPNSKIYTVNIPPEDIRSGKGGKLITNTLEEKEIGIEYKKRKLENIIQIYANTATWAPNIGLIDIAFIDGCHDKEFVFNDTAKILRYMKPGGFIIWHDFNISLVNKFNWLYEVCLGIEKLYRKNLIKGRIFHIKDSWTGIYHV